MPFISSFKTGDIIPPLSGKFMSVFILDEGHFLLVDQIRGVILICVLVVVEEPHIFPHVGGIVDNSHGVVAGNVIPEQYIATVGISAVLK